MMEDDYITCLLNWLQADSPNVEKEYIMHLGQESQAMDALFETLSEEQKDMLLEYEEQRNIVASLSEDAFARRAFLLARDIFRP